MEGLGVLGLGPTSAPFDSSKGFSSEGHAARTTLAGAAPGDGLSPPRVPPHGPTQARACPQDQVVCSGWVTLARAGASEMEGRDSGAPSAHLLLGLGGWRCWGWRGEGKAQGGERALTAGHGPA